MSWAADMWEKKLAGRGHNLCNARLFLIWLNQIPLSFVHGLDGEPGLKEDPGLEGDPDTYEPRVP